MLQNIAIFCRVIDNFGDAGVCLRLARALHKRTNGYECAAHIQIYIDLPQHILPMLDADDLNAVDRKTLQILPLATLKKSNATLQAADLVIEAFASSGGIMPQVYLDAMDARYAVGLPCVWLNLEYLSAETWVEGVHGLPYGLRRQSGLQQYLFCPGFTAKTGGLLRFGLSNNDFPSSNLHDTDTTITRSLRIFCFAYYSLPRDALARAIAAAETHLACEIELIDTKNLCFMPQTEFDALLWSCDGAIVRGEESPIRAMLGGVPLLWQLYPTPDGAQGDKLAAWLALPMMQAYCAAVPSTAAACLSLNRDCENAKDENTNCNTLEKNLCSWLCALAKPETKRASQVLQAEIRALPELSQSILSFYQSQHKTSAKTAA